MSKKLTGKAKQKARKSSRKSFKIAKTLFQFGAFYKGMEDDGFVFSIDTQSEPVGFVNMLHKQVVKAGKGLIEEFKTGTWDIDGCKEQLADAIESFNVKTYGSTDRPMVHPRLAIQVSVDTMPELICIMSDIYALEQVGVIKSDDYNGMMYSYSNF